MIVNPKSYHYGRQPGQHGARGLAHVGVVAVCVGLHLCAEADAVLQERVVCLAYGAESLLALLAGKDILVGAIDVASDAVETPEDVASVVAEVIKHVPKERIQLCTNCGMAPMRRDIAARKLGALAQGAALARASLG